MDSKSFNFESVVIAIEDILLDPNNPRFADIFDNTLLVSEERAGDENVQTETYHKMLHEKFAVKILAKSIETVGFLPVDQIVVKRYLNTNKYVVIEGNRRIAAIKLIINNYNSGQSFLSDNDINALSTITTLVLTNENDFDLYSMIIQGVRNVSGIKDWDAFQKGQFIHKMRDNGKKPPEISKMIGMTIVQVERYYNTYKAMTQFKNDMIFGDRWHGKYFSHLEEIIKSPDLRKYFGWNSQIYEFEDNDKIQRFYNWITPNPEDADYNPTFSDHKELRKLKYLINNSKALDLLDDGNLQGALNLIEEVKPEITFDECMTKIYDAIRASRLILTEEYENLITDDQINDLKSSVENLNKSIERIRKFKNNV